jgi:phasin family protein
LCGAALPAAPQPESQEQATDTMESPMTQTEHAKMAKNPNPFLNLDYAKWMTEFDPLKMTEQFTKLAGQYKLEGVDANALVDIQRRNLEAFSVANRAAAEGIQAVAKRQAEIFKETLDTLSGAFGEVGKSATPQDVAAKQAEIAKDVFETAVENMRELADMVAKSNDLATKAINARIAESLDEIKDMALKLEKKN